MNYNLKSLKGQAPLSILKGQAPLSMKMLIITILEMLLLVSIVSAQETDKPEETWLMPSAQEQLYSEGMDDKKGLGRIFVPAMTNPADEPFYAVFDSSGLVGEQNMGSSIFVPPGRYTVLFGSGALDQKLRREVIIDRGESVIVAADWSSLTVEVLNEHRDYHQQDLQVFRVKNAESFGLISAINPELGEHLQTLILKPGLYKIVKRGEDFNTYVNFATVYLESGKYTPFTIVVDTVSGGFVGAGILTTVAQLKLRRNWKPYSALHGSVVFNAHNDASQRKYQIDLTTLLQVDTRILYERFPHYYLSNNLMELTAIKQQGEEFSISQDRLQLKNTYVYYLLTWLGGYGRFEVTTHLFPRYSYFESNRNAILRDLEGNDQTRYVNRVAVYPAGFPLELKEGIGINVTPLRSFIAKLSFRTGIGYWQTYNRDVYQQDAEVDTLFYLLPDTYPQGLESSVISNFAILNNLTVTTEFNILFPFHRTERTVADLENFLSLRLTKNVTIEHTLRLKRDPNPDIGHLLQEQFLSLRFSYFFL
ncbi:hypothetical protein ACFLQV_03630 [Calditrichota bacterium]